MARRDRAQGAARLDIAPVLEFYGLRLDRGRSVGWFAVQCPFHPDSRASARVTLEDGGAFKCHGCDMAGDAISLLIAKGDAHDFTSALGFYEDSIGGSVPEVRSRPGGQPRRKVLDGGARDYERGSSLFQARLRRRSGGGA